MPGWDTAVECSCAEGENETMCWIDQVQEWWFTWQCIHGKVAPPSMARSLANQLRISVEWDISETGASRWISLYSHLGAVGSTVLETQKSEAPKESWIVAANSSLKQSLTWRVVEKMVISLPLKIQGCVSLLLLQYVRSGEHGTIFLASRWQSVLWPAKPSKYRGLVKSSQLCSHLTFFRVRFSNILKHNTGLSTSEKSASTSLSSFLLSFSLFLFDILFPFTIHLIRLLLDFRLLFQKNSFLGWKDDLVEKHTCHTSLRIWVWSLEPK